MHNGAAVSTHPTQWCCCVHTSKAQVRLCDGCTPASRFPALLCVQPLIGAVQCRFFISPATVETRPHFPVSRDLGERVNFTTHQFHKPDARSNALLGGGCVDMRNMICVIPLSRIRKHPSRKRCRRGTSTQIAQLCTGPADGI